MSLEKYIERLPFSKNKASHNILHKNPYNMTE